MQVQNVALRHGIVRCWTGGNGPALLLLHCAWGDAEFSWSRVWNDLEQSFRVLAPDLPGFGGSEPLNEPTTAALAAVLEELLVAHGIEQAFVVGNSFSVYLGLHFARLHSNRVAKLILVNGMEFPVLPAWVRAPFRADGARRALVRVWARLMLTSEWVVRPAFSRQSELPSDFLQRLRKNPDPEGRARVLVHTWLNQSEPAALLGVPLGLIWGTEDRGMPLSRAHALQRFGADAKLVTIEKAGHMPQAEQPKEFIKALTALLQ